MFGTLTEVQQDEQGGVNIGVLDVTVILLIQDENVRDVVVNQSKKEIRKVEVE